MWEPQGPLPQEIYRRRRVAAVGAALVLLLVVIIVIAVSCRGGGSEEPTPAAAAAGTSEASATPDPSASASATASASTTPSGTASGEAPKPADTPEGERKDDTVPGGQCSDAAIGLTVESEKPNYEAGEPVTFLTTVTNIGSVPCVRDLSGPMIVNTVSAVDGGQVWSNADCYPGTGSDIRTLEPGQQAQFKMEWAGTTSTQGCAPADRTPVQPGVYAVTTHLGTLASDPVPFNIH